MRFSYSLLYTLLLLACQPNKNTADSPPPTAAERVGIYKNATVYAGGVDYEFEIAGKSTLIRVNLTDSLRMPKMPNNLTVMSEEGPPVANPILLGSKYLLTFGPQSQLKSMELMGSHDPSSTELPSIPQNYSGLLSTGDASDSRLYLHLAADLTAILLIDDEAKPQPTYKHGRWTRSADGQLISAQMDNENWQFLVKDGAIGLTSNQLGANRITLMANDVYDLCYYVQNWLSDLSTIDDEKRVQPENITNETPLSEVLRTEHAYMSLYGTLEVNFQVEEAATAKTLRANPTVQGVCDLVMRITEEEVGH